MSAQERVSASTVEIAEDGYDDFGRRAKGGRKDKTAKELAALARLQSNYGCLLNPQGGLSMMDEAQLDPRAQGRFDDALESKPRASLDNRREGDGESAQRGDGTVKTGRGGRDRSPVGDAPHRDKRDDRRRSRSRDKGDARDSRGGGGLSQRGSRNEDTSRGGRRGDREDGRYRSRSRDRDDRVRPRSAERKRSDGDGDRRRRDRY